MFPEVLRLGWKTKRNWTNRSPRRPSSSRPSDQSSSNSQKQKQQSPSATAATTAGQGLSINQSINQSISQSVIVYNGLSNQHYCKVHQRLLEQKGLHLML